jgi:hypothetical protein
VCSVLNQYNHQHRRPLAHAIRIKCKMCINFRLICRAFSSLSQLTFYYSCVGKFEYAHKNSIERHLCTRFKREIVLLKPLFQLKSYLFISFFLFNSICYLNLFKQKWRINSKISRHRTKLRFAYVFSNLFNFILQILPIALVFENSFRIYI